MRGPPRRTIHIFAEESEDLMMELERAIGPAGDRIVHTTPSQHPSPTMMNGRADEVIDLARRNIWR
jgi:hypothetical protein